MLTVNDHSRDSAGLTYVYPVISRRSGGLSIGINLNPNNACNWRCIYCQVPNLIRGTAPYIDLQQLRDELESFLNEVLYGDFYETYEVPEELRTIQDIAISGNGESTSAENFDEIIKLITEIIAEFKLKDEIKLVLITNGSLVNKPVVQTGLSLMKEFNGEVWFKVDSATDAGIKKINNAALSIERVKLNLKTASELCPTWLQTCLFQLDGKAPSEDEQDAYLEFLSWVKQEKIGIQGILLYGLARESYQPEASRLSTLSEEWINNFADNIRLLNLEVRLST